MKPNDEQPKQLKKKEGLSSSSAEEQELQTKRALEKACEEKQKVIDETRLRFEKEKMVLKAELCG